MSKLTAIIGLAVITLFLLVFLSSHYSPKTNISASPLPRASRYLWVQTFPVTTTKLDCTFSNVWFQVTMKSLSKNLFIKFAADGDTTSFNSRIEFKLLAGENISFGSAVKVRRISVRTEAGTDTLYAIGYKSTRQF